MNFNKEVKICLKNYLEINNENRMAIQASGIIKHLLGMGVVATINHTLDADTAEYLVKEFGNIPIREKKPDLNILKAKKNAAKNRMIDVISLLFNSEVIKLYQNFSSFY